MKILGINSSGQPVQMTNAVVTTLGNVFWSPGYSTVADQVCGLRPILAFPNYNAGRVQLFIMTGVNSVPTPLSAQAPIFTSFDGLVKLPITYTSGTFTKGHTISGSISGASGTISEDPTLRFSGNPTEIYVEGITSGPFVSGDVLSTSPGGAAGTVNATPSTDGMGDAWKIETAITAGQVYETRSIQGLFPVAVGGATKLVAIAKTTTDAYCRVYDPETDTWGARSSSLGSDYAVANPRSVLWGTKVCNTTDNGGVRIIDFASGTPAAAYGGLPTAYTWQTCMVGVVTGNLYVSYVYTGNIALAKYVAGSWSLVGTISATTSSSNRTVTFESPDGSHIILVSLATGTVAYRVTVESPFTYEDITSNLPSGFSSIANTPVYIVRDRTTNGATGTPDVIVIWQNQSSGAMAVARCDAYNSWTDLGSNTSGVTHAFGESVDGMFDVTYEPGANLGILTGDVAAVPGGQRFTYRVFGTGSVNFELLIEQDGMSGPQVRGTLGSPSQGTLTDGNKKITGVSADGNEKTAVWLGSSDGFSDGEFVFRVPFIST